MPSYHIKDKFGRQRRQTAVERGDSSPVEKNITELMAESTLDDEQSSSAVGSDTPPVYATATE
jgi:hypothetical protein